MNFKGYIKIIRPANTIMSGFTACIAYIIASGMNVETAIALFGIVTSICGGGNTINDYYDRAIDAINRPERPIPAKLVSPMGAFCWAYLLFIIGIAISCTTNVLCIIIAIVNVLILIIYAKILKKLPLLGNIAVAYLSGSIFLFGGTCVNPESILVVLPLFAITFFGTLAREILKDAEDVIGDASDNAKTLPILIGVQKSGYIALILVILAIVASIIPVTRWGYLYLSLILVIDLWILISAIRSSKCTNSDELISTHSTSYIKYGMFATLILFLCMELVHGKTLII